MTPTNQTDAHNIARSFVKELGMSLSNEAEAELVTQLQESLRWDKDADSAVMLDAEGNPRVKVLSDGSVADLSPRDFVELTALKLGARTKATSQSSPSKSGQTMTERAKVFLAQKSDRKSFAAAEASKGNPWLAGAKFNRSSQAIITNCDPALAQRLKAEAGVR